jgi:hypothetical protein
MANVDNAFGLRAVKNSNGSPYNGSGSLYYKAVGDTEILAPGDPVVVTGTASTGGIPTITRATAGVSNAITGVMISRSDGIDGDVTLTRDKALNSPASTEDYIMVEDGPGIVYEIQVNGTLVVTDISNNANLTAGVATQGKSLFEVDQSSVGTNAGNQLKILRLRQIPNNSVGADAVVEVIINNHTLTSHEAGV